MADTTTLLPGLRPLKQADEIHYPVLVPNMRGLESLLELEDSAKASRNGSPLTNEIAVFVSATEVGETTALTPAVLQGEHERVGGESAQRPAGGY